MKFVLSILVVLGATASLHAFKLPAVGSGALAKELQDMADVVPLDKIIEISKAYMAKDKEFQLIMRLIRSDDVKAWVLELEAHPLFKKLMNYLQSHGLDIYLMVNKFNESIGVKPLVPSTLVNRKIIGGMNGYLYEIVAVLPLQQLQEKFEYKREHSPLFREVLETFTTKEYADFYFSQFSNPHLQKLQREVKQAGLDSQLFLSVLPLFLGAFTMLQ